MWAIFLLGKFEFDYFRKTMQPFLMCFKQIIFKLKLYHSSVTSFRRCKKQYYISVSHMHALSKEIEHMYENYIQS